MENAATSSLSTETVSPLEITDDTLEFFLSYKQFPRDGDEMEQKARKDRYRSELIEAASKIREEALKVCNYRCIRECRFLESRLAAHPQYKSLILDQIQVSNPPQLPISTQTLKDNIATSYFAIIIRLEEENNRYWVLFWN